MFDMALNTPLRLCKNAPPPKPLFNQQLSTSYSFLWVPINFLGTILLWKTSCKLILKGEFYSLVVIKRYSKVDSSFKKQTLRSVYLRTIDRKLTLNLIVIFNSFTDILFLKYVTKIFCISYYFQEKNWECFKLHFSVAVFVYILSSKGANQLQVLYVRTLENIQWNFSTEAAFLKCIPSNFFLEICTNFRTTC